MRYAEADYQLRLASEQTAREARNAEHARSLQLAREGAPSPSLRRRIGAAVIAFGVRLAGDRAVLREDRTLARAS
jgi:hypothetical protein